METKHKGKLYMCGRYSLTSEAYDKFLELLEGQFVGPVPERRAPSRFNIAPLQPIPVIRLWGSDLDQAVISDQPLPPKEVSLMRWGLIPHWVKEGPTGKPIINARSETIAEKPSFRGPFRRRKCLVPADGFYEWKRGAASPIPYYFHLPDRKPFAFAGIWEIWMGPHGEDWLETVCFATKAATGIMKPIHNRSPVIVDRQDYDLWLTPRDPPDTDIFQKLGTRCDAALQMYEVSGFVNNARNDGEDCIKPAKGSQINLF